MTNTAATKIPMIRNCYDGLETDHVLVTPSGRWLGIGAVPKGQEGRKVCDGPLVPGPWAYTFGLATVIDNRGGTGSEMKQLDAEKKVHPVDTGDRLEIDGITYEITIHRRDFIDLKKVTP